MIGNGGSAADAQHIAAEIVGRYKQERGADAAIALTTDSSVLTAIANDYGFEQVFARYGRLDVLVNNAGNIHAARHFLDADEAWWDQLLDVNLKGAMFQAQAAARHMMVQGRGGKQVHMGSVRSLLALRGRGYAAYCATKGGLAILCKQLAAEWAPYNINVNVVAPTFVRTPLVEPMLSDAVFYNQLVTRIPLGRLASPEDVMGAIAFLVSPASNFITGHILYVDGGWTIH